MKPSPTPLNISNPQLISSVILQCDLFSVVTISITLINRLFLFARPSNLAPSYSLASPANLPSLFLLRLMASNHKAILAVPAPLKTFIALLLMQAVYINNTKKDTGLISKRTYLFLTQVKRATTKLYLLTRTPFT